MSENSGDERQLRVKHHKIQNHDFCDCCTKNNGIILYCDGCDCSFHLQCACPPIASDKIPEKEWFCRVCSYRLGITKLDIPENDPFYLVHKHLTTVNPIQFEVPRYISKYTDYEPPKKPTKYSRDVCEYCEQKGVHVKCAHPGCSRAFHLQCHDPPLFAIPKIFFCDIHTPKKEKKIQFLKPTSVIFLHESTEDQSFFSPVSPLIKLEEKLKR
ncbi:PHD-finger domain containing protein [Entamoeba histolytica HM-3:IMSS]|uniref:PHD-type domain-containing protein n=4 Tax=Entamoeba TaxID=5758 RepID=C4M4I8_ENTH1|nr:PHD-finger domain containing protein [Entamoeba nuttalli P19]XP_651645.2 hypothetical protein EHI_138970 [Entamoeba histolytica HM-1:IMSS]EMS14860.1 PHD-finger domain containing protein [Entamoeba histolytica HM-3:IMSS]GAT96292.1 hypothetical protein CL6EHI_138970 [Entamoeba histolytica]EAL46255.2 hypothetical protein EHI_138970 [Entamoeba histolytica HM-1:IMSS]EKE42505.1 PHD-finger domain containing protein [Entamoeba nuttalli P19]|eukprot:XP_008855156.1 PHD-finger domain containing protein [Entamoeba nuttalli P19]